MPVISHYKLVPFPFFSARSAFKNETAELANQTRRLGRGIRELAETSPQLREVVRALSGRVDELKKDGEV